MQGLPEDDPIGFIVGEPPNVGPRSLHEQDIARLQFQFGQMLADVLLPPPNGQHIDAELRAESRLRQPHADQPRLRQEDDFGQADVVEVEGLAGFGRTELVGCGKGLQALLLARYIQHVACLDAHIGRGHRLRDVVDEWTLLARLLTHLDDAQAEAAIQVQLANGLTHKGRVPVYLEAAHIVGYLVFLHEGAQGFAAPAPTLLLLARTTEQPACQREQHDDAREDADDADGQEGEEGEFRIARLHQHLVYDKVGRRTDKGQHAAHRTGKGQRHEQSRYIAPGLRSHRNDNGQH